MPDGIRVLYVDDEAHQLDIGKGFLEANGGLTVDTVLSAPAALDILNKKTYDIIVSDYLMPQMNGIDFLKKVRAADKTIPFILFTGREREEVVIEALNNGANFYLQKGEEPDSLYKELGHVIRQAVLIRQTQLTLAEQEQRCHDLQNASDLIQSVTPDGHFLFVNKKWLDTLGYSETELPGLTIFDIIHEESRRHCTETFQRVISGESMGIIDAVFRTHDGRKIYVEGIATCRMAEGKCQYTRGIFKDVTERKEIEKGLYESEDKFATVFKSNPVSLTLVAATDGVFVDVNDAFLRGTGYLREEVLGKTSEEIGLFPDMTEYHRLVQSLREKRYVRDLEIRCRIKSGEIRNCRFSSSIVIMGNEPHILSTVEDITEQKAAEAAHHALVAGIVGTTGWESLDRITESISTWLAADCIMIGEITPDHEHVQVLSMLLDGKKIKDYSYTLKGTPCENTAQKDFCMYSDEVAKLFPESRDLREFNIRGYIGTSLRNAEGKVVGILCILTRKPLSLPPSGHEIIEIIAAKAAAEIGRLHALRALSESEEKFRTLVEYSLDGILILDPKGTILFANPAAGVIVEAENYRDLIDTKNVMDFLSLESQKDAVLDFDDVARGADGFLARYKIITANKRERWVESLGKSIIFNNALSILISLRDITNRKQAEEALHESKEMLALVMNGVATMISYMDPGLRFVYINKPHAAWFGCPEADLIGKNLKDVLPEDEFLRVSPYYKEVLEGHMVTFESPSRDHEGRSRVLVVRLLPHIREGQVVGIFAALNDITERKRDEQALRQVNKKLNLLSGITRHDIKNQLLALDGFIAILRNKNPDPSYDHFFSRITTASDQISNMIKFTKEYEEIGVNAPAWQDIRTLIDNAGRDATPGPITFINDIPAGTEVFADPLILRVFFNLVDNAVRHGSEITTIRFSLEERNADQVIVCADDGGGVAADEKEMIFDLGYGKNTGFGLAISREILDITGITITETGVPGNGARFEIAVPKGQYRVS